MHVFVMSFGCSSSVAEGTVLAGCLAQAGYELARAVSTADVVVLNTCGVKGPTEDRMIDIAKRISNAKKLIVAGCLPLISFKRLQKEVPFSGVVGPASGERIVEVVERVSRGEKVVAIDQSLDDIPRLDLPRVQSSPVISIVPVSHGCLGSCAYCCVVVARGRLRSCDMMDIVERVKKDLASGLREFWITSQDTACYGKDRGADLAQLLHAICSVDGDFRVRVGMMTPNNALDILEKLVEAFGDERIFKFIHLPVQSGDDKVLERMRRFYRVEDFERVVEAFKTRFPSLSLSTDIICGFPGESEEAFGRTLRLLEEVRPDVVNVSKFFARPGTAAADMREDFVPPEDIKRRSVMASALAKKLSFESNRRWVGWTGEILVDEVGRVSGSMVGRNFAYKPVVVSCISELMGNFARARVTKPFPTYLEGQIIQ
jgi:threonylcarbamoyladenosine tRNA methylthiotransferase CDKAL1